MSLYSLQGREKISELPSFSFANSYCENASFWQSSDFMLNEMFTWDLSSGLKDLKAYWKKNQTNRTNPTYYRIKWVSDKEKSNV